ncbi:PREDICTED: LOW QUALITY PROTEIN: glutathione reductase-like [Cariama cristata]|uniref:LOW QUALITY PROTEIN: glutathione reductase-like n=1 Tax=Cariama cristata TaxID=54380 RepID=UPI000520609E|nr:PREDICTED: LOW QUALITY PROTEIN: glutathione reductase-like [Cariama cristata]
MEGLRTLPWDGVPTVPPQLGTRQPLLRPAQAHHGHHWQCILARVGAKAAAISHIRCAGGPQGPWVVNEYQNSTTRGVYAIGDVCRRALLTPVAIGTSRKLAHRLFKGKQESWLDYRDTPTISSSGTMGLTKDEAMAMHRRENVKIYSTSFTPLYHTISQRKFKCVVKLVCAGRRRRCVAELHMQVWGCNELLWGFAVTFKIGTTMADLNNTITIHPISAKELVTLC